MTTTTPAIVCDPCAAERLSRARRWLAESRPGEELLVLAASQEAASDLIRDCIGPPAGMAVAAFGWHRATLGQLASSIASPSLARAGLAAVTPVSIEGVVASVLQALGEAHALGRYQNIRELPGFPRAVATALTELRLAAVSADRLRSFEPELARILERFQVELVKTGVIDRAGVLEVALATLADAAAHPALAGLPMLILDVPITTGLEARLIEALIGRSPKVLITAAHGDTATLQHLRRMPGLNAFDHEPAAARATKPLQRLAHRLFQGLRADAEPIASTKPQPALTESIAVLSAPGENRECVEIARRALDFARAGIAFDRMAVLLRAPQAYRAPLTEALERAEIPTHFSRGATRPDPSGRAFLALLGCAAEGLSASRFSEYLSLGELPEIETANPPTASVTDPRRWLAPDRDLLPRVAADADADADADSGADPLLDPNPDSPRSDGTDQRLRAPRRWERLLADAVVIGGRERWTSRLTALAVVLRRRLETAEGNDDATHDAIQRDLDDLSALRDYAMPLLDALQALPTTARWREWLEPLCSIALRALRHPDRVLAGLAELAPISAVGPVGLQEVRLVLSRRLADLTVPPTRDRQGRIFIAPIEAARGMCFDVVFVPGLAERVFPAKIAEHPILLDEARLRLDAGLAVNEDRIARERSLLHDAVGAAREHLVISYPRLDLEQARPRVPSFYALEVLRAAEGRLPDFRELAARAETAADARVGWPAPADPTQAIDEAEHDLALLDTLLQLNPEQSIGTARYLLGVNPHLGRALRFRARRWLRRWTPADGLVDPSPAGREAMRAHRLDARSYSATAIQTYAECPYKFLLYAVHRLAPRETVIARDEMDALSRGSLIHDTQFALYGRLQALDLLPIEESNLEPVQAVLDEALDTVAAEYRERFRPGIDRVWQDGIAAIRADLREWLRRESVDSSGFAPWRFELAFGLRRSTERDPNSVADPIELDCGIKLRGAIDLIERHAEGRVRVTDHKTGKNRTNRGQIIGGGSSLQPLLYALAAERLFPEATVETGRLYFCTSRGGFSEQSVALNDYSRASATTLADTLREALHTPFLPAAPAPRRCAWCDYRVVCGPYEEMRTQRKPRDRIEPLLRLRSMQ